ncbi:hypothetical protein COU56_00665 [Candidatus Pacearchaeota archaeon CG10_big_fil_rev_8_21_14_0_10_31_9]|nr:MAG: hypothetical protein COU56_00665 [Candidatus Pacearchaeota archaeon CG10_big_fil_rev_8_21_14_0_10_31_9]
MVKKENKTLLWVGIGLIVLGIFSGAYTTSQEHLWGLYNTTSTPYSTMAFPLLLVGIILIIVHFVKKR